MKFTLFVVVGKGQYGPMIFSATTSAPGNGRACPPGTRVLKLNLELPDNLLDPTEVTIDLTEESMQQRISEALVELTSLTQENKHD